MTRPILVVVSLRGGVDALNAVIPYRDGDYYRLRPSLAVAPPGKARRAAIDIDGFYGLHPSLAPLVLLWERRELAIVHAVGWPGVSHSHFEAWEEIEAGALGSDRPPSGWLARALALFGTENESALRAGSESALRAVAFADTMPRLLAGALGATAIRSLEELRLAGAEDRRRNVEKGLRLLYERAALPVGGSGIAALDAVAAIDRCGGVGRTSAGGQTPFARQLGMIARLIQAGVGLETATAELGGWDFHFGAGSTDGPMARLLSEFAGGVAGFARDLGPDWKRVVLVAISEFGRRAQENGSGGTDHGQGGLIFVAGGAVEGGRVAGEWPGLAERRLAGPGDLAITTDFRDVLLEVLPRGLSVGRTRARLSALSEDEGPGPSSGVTLRETTLKATRGEPIDRFSGRPGRRERSSRASSRASAPRSTSSFPATIASCSRSLTA